MEIEKALAIIQQRLQQAIESTHFVEQSQERNIPKEEIRMLLRTEKILGIVEQGDNTYKIWLSYNEYKDLNIIVRILEQGQLKLITLLPCYCERRRR